MFSDLKGRTAIVFGVANKRSIAWSIAQGLHNAGAPPDHHLPERTPRAGSPRPHRFPARRRRLHVRRLERRGNRPSVRTNQRASRQAARD